MIMIIYATNFCIAAAGLIIDQDTDFNLQFEYTK